MLLVTSVTTGLTFVFWWVFFIMNLFLIKSPNGISHTILAQTIFQACQIAVERDQYVFSNVDYLKLNGNS